MRIERKMIHDIVELIPESDISKIYAILNAYLSFDDEDILSKEQEIKMKDGFTQIACGDYVAAGDYMKKRGLTLN